MIHPSNGKRKIKTQQKDLADNLIDKVKFYGFI